MKRVICTLFICSTNWFFFTNRKQSCGRDSWNNTDNMFRSNCLWRLLVQRWRKSNDVVYLNILLFAHICSEARRVAMYELCCVDSRWRIQHSLATRTRKSTEAMISVTDVAVLSKLNIVLFYFISFKPVKPF